MAHRRNISVSHVQTTIATNCKKCYSQFKMPNTVYNNTHRGGVSYAKDMRYKFVLSLMWKYLYSEFARDNKRFLKTDFFKKAQRAS